MPEPDVSLDAGRAAATFALPSSKLTWRGDREAEGTRLLSGRRTKSYRGFESRPLRKDSRFEREYLFCGSLKRRRVGRESARRVAIRRAGLPERSDGRCPTKRIASLQAWRGACAKPGRELAGSRKERALPLNATCRVAPASNGNRS